MCDSDIKKKQAQCVHMHIQENHRNQVREKQNVLEEKDEKKIYQNDRIFKKHEQLNRKKNTVL